MDIQFFGGRGSSSGKGSAANSGKPLGRPEKNSGGNAVTKTDNLPLMVEGKLNPKVIDNLTSNWEGNRWTKGNYDRLYPVSEDLGFVIQTYKTGNINYAEVKELPPIDGVDMKLVNYYTGQIANSRMSKITGYVSNSWIDLRDGKIDYKYGLSRDKLNDDWLFVLERMKYRVLSATKK